MPSYSVLEGDCLSTLSCIPDGSVQACVTSPPYWGLRDYGTATWEGGDPSCDHLGKPMATRANVNRNTGGRDVKNAEIREFYRSECGKCGAMRVDEQVGLEETPEAYTERIVEVFREVRRVLRDDGTLWLNLGDSYAGSGKGRRADGSHQEGGKQGTSRGTIEGSLAKTPSGDGLKPKDLVGIPWRVAFALQDDGWYLRSDIIWAKPNPMPESVTDRPTKSHEYLFLLTKSPRYYYDADAVREAATETTFERLGRNGVGASVDPSRRDAEPDMAKAPHPAGRNRRSVWTVASTPFAGAHFAVFPTALIEPCVLAGSSEGGQCAECGTPLERVVERGEPLIDQQVACGGDANGEYHGEAVKDYAPSMAQDASATKARILAGMVERRTVGWESPCDCDAGAVPQTVLDPFCGSGTTGVVSLRRGRDFVGLELNPEYAAMARSRIGDDAPLLNTEVVPVYGEA